MNSNIFKYLIFALCALSSPTRAQELNLSFEHQELDPWFLIGKSEEFDITIDKSVHYHGEQSVRIERSEPTDTFGGVMQFIPGNLKGDSIEVTVRVKLDSLSTESKLGFMLRIDPGIYFENYEQYNVTGTSDWKKYSIKTKLSPEKTSAISVAVFLSGTGTIWADQIEIKVDGKSISSEMYGAFAVDYSATTSSEISEFTPTPEINARLTDLAKIWGLIKYRHPELAKGKIEWDRQLFSSIDYIIKANGQLDLEDHYLELLDRLGEVPQVNAVDPLEAEQPADYSWIEELPFSTTLKNRLNQLRYASFTAHHYYAFSPNIGNVKIENEYPYPHLTNPDVGFRLLSLFRYWNIVQYFSPYRYLADTPWNEVLADYIPKFIASKDQLGYEETVSALLGEIKDAHTKLWSGSKALPAKMGNRMLPITLKFAEGQAVVHKLSLQNNEVGGIKVGDVILKKNGKTISEIQDSVFHLISSPNPAVIEREMAQVIARSKNQLDLLELDRSGKRIHSEIATIPASEFKIENDTAAIKWLDDGIAYLNQGNLTEAILAENEEKLRESKALLIDCRNYPKDFLVFVLPPYLLPKATPFVKFTKTSYARLGDFAFTPPLSVGDENVDYYKGKVAILINENTQSSAEYHVMAYRNAPQAKVFGSQTAGADGNISGFHLPGGLYSAISGIGVYYPDGTETQRIGIIPDVTVKPTIAGLRAERDEVLEKAINYLKK